MFSLIEFVVIYLLAMAIVCALIMFWLLHKLGKQTEQLRKKIEKMEKMIEEKRR